MTSGFFAGGRTPRTASLSLLESLGAKVRYNLFSGGHTFAPWREELAPALKWLIGGTAQQDDAGRQAARLGFAS